MIDILFENSAYVVCVKPVGVQSQNDGAEDMVKLLKNQTGSDIFPVHRLDTVTGGTMVFAKTQKAAAELSRQIEDRRFKKIYLAVVSGVPEKDNDTFEDLLFKDSRKNKSYVVKRQRKGVKKASLEYTTVASAEGLSLVRVLLHTGRTHQIRVQFASRKLPLVGDGKYGSKDNRCETALWSEQLSFVWNKKECVYKSCPDFNSFPWNLFKLQ